MLLSQYVLRTQELLADPYQQFYPLPSVISWVNRARNRVALDTQCIRVMPPSSGSFVSIAVTNGGSAYSAPVVSISYPDAIGGGFVQATATATVVGGVITAISVVEAGSGYCFPQVTITDPTGTGATTSYVLTPFLATAQGQESYSFASMIPLLPTGVKAITGIQNLSISWGSMAPSLRRRSFSTFQAQYRAWNIGAQNFPEVFALNGQGTAASIYVYPIPAQTSQMIVDAYAIPSDLVNDESVDVIPDPFADGCAYYAASLGFLQAQRRDDADAMRAEYTRHNVENSAATQPAMVPDPYDGDGW